MSHLSHIIEQVKSSGSYEEPWRALVNAYFRGADCFERIEHWADQNWLTVSFSDERQSCTFRAKRVLAK
jgi:hypothetical protein